MMKTFTSLLALTLIPALAACSSSKKEKEIVIPPNVVERHYERMLTRMDYNNDNKLTCEDTRYSRQVLFQGLDINRDGILTEREYRGAQFEDKAFMFHTFRELDKSENGILEASEFITVADNGFLSADKDADCVISPMEAAKAVEKQRRLNAGNRKRDDKPRRAPTEGVDPF